MPKHFDLFDQFAHFPALLAACERAARGKRRKPGAAAFLAHKEHHLLRMLDTLRAGTWQPGRYTEIRIDEPKPRLVSAAPFGDRVLHQALCGVIGPVFERGFVADSFANRQGKGTHKAIARYEHYSKRFAHVLRCDIYRYFPAIDHQVLKADLRRKLACVPTLRVLDAIIDGSNAQEPVHLYYPGDDLWTPHERRRGLPIGNLTSQLFGNIFLNPMDHFVKEVLRAPGYVRYVDDFALFHDDPSLLAQWQMRVQQFLAQRRLSLHPHKTWVQPSAMPNLFLGLVLHPSHRALAPDNVDRFRRRLTSLRHRWQAGTVSQEEVNQRVGGWIAHARHAQTWRLRHTLFRGGWFDPEAPAPPDSDACCAAAPGTTTQSTSGPPTATTTPPTTATTTSACVLPEQPATLPCAVNAQGLPELPASRCGQALPRGCSGWAG